MKTITPFKGNDVVVLNLKGNFSKVLIVKISKDYEVCGKLIERKALPRVRGDRLVLNWADIAQPTPADPGSTRPPGNAGHSRTAPRG